MNAATNTPASLELVISAAASIVNASQRRQDLIRLITTDGSDSGFAAGHAHIEAVMEHLAAIEASHDAAFRRVISNVARSATGGALVAVVANMAQAEIDTLVRLRKRFGSVTIVQFDPSSWDPSIVVPPTSLRDGVLRITGERPFADAWNQIMRPTRQTRYRPTFKPDIHQDPEGDRWAAHARIRP